jgi:signal transduction histidine kinase
MKSNRGMTLQLFRLLILAGICAFLFFILLHVCTGYLISKYYPGSELQLQMIENRIKNFENYISDHAIPATDTAALLNWCGRQPMVLMEIYRDNILYFNSKYVYSDPLIDHNIKTTRYDWYSYYEVLFADGPAEVLVYSDESYILNSWLTIAALILSGIVFTVIVLAGIRKTIQYIYLLCDEIQIMGSGDLEHPVTVKGNNELGLLAKELDHMRSALFYHRQNELDMIRQNQDMITSLSHDLRTPLAKLLLYTEIIQNNKYKDKLQLRRYLVRICEKGSQIKEISDHLLKYSLSQSQPQEIETLISSYRTAFYDRLSEMTDYLKAHGFPVECDIDWRETQIRYNDLFLNRILDNIVSNIDKYAEKSYPVIMRSVDTGYYIGVSVKNIQSSCCDCAESNGVGIESIRAMMRQMSGSCTIKQTETAFEITLLFPKT